MTLHAVQNAGWQKPPAAGGGEVVHASSDDVYGGESFDSTSPPSSGSFGKVHPVNGGLGGTSSRRSLSRTGTLSKSMRHVRSRMRHSDTFMVVRMELKDRYVLNPRSKILFRWDTLIGSLLFFTAVVTPFEVSFLETRYNALFALNRLVDLCFITDMVLQFFLPFQSNEGEWMVHQPTIVKRYLRGWFAIDLVSVLPYDVLSLAAGGGESLRNVKLLRIARLMRLTKLLRILRAGRMFERWEASMPINYSLVALIKFALIVMSLSHWLACGWHMVAGDREGEGGDLGVGNRLAVNWVDNYPFMGVEASTFTLYIASYYWAVATLSTLGYGDVVPTTDGERAYATVACLFGATVYAYVIGAVCSIVAGMNAKDTAFYSQMDALNTFIDEKDLSPALQTELRDFMRFLRYNAGLLERNSILHVMSPKLRGMVSLEVNAKWVRRVPVFGRCREDFIVELSLTLSPETYSQAEDVVKPGSPADRMYIIEKGIVGCRGRILAAGGFFGEDMVVNHRTRARGGGAGRVGPVPRRSWLARTLTNTAVQTMRQQDLIATLGRFPGERNRVRRAVIFQAVRRILTQFAAAVHVVWRTYPLARVADMWETIEKCHGDTEALPDLFDGKMKVEEILRTTPLWRVEKAVGVITSVFRLRRFRLGVVERQQARREHQEGAAALRGFLAKNQLSAYEAVFVRHRMTYDMLAKASAGDLSAAMGLPFGVAIQLVGAYERDRKAAEEAAEARALGLPLSKKRLRGARPKQV